MRGLQEALGSGTFGARAHRMVKQELVSETPATDRGRLVPAHPAPGVSVAFRILVLCGLGFRIIHSNILEGVYRGRVACSEALGETVG